MMMMIVRVFPLKAATNVFDGEQLVAYWGKGLDKFIIECLRKKKWLPTNRYIDIYYKGYIFTKVFFYVYATDARIIHKRIVLKLVFISKFKHAICATLLVNTKNCHMTFLDVEHSHYVCYTLMRELNRFVKNPRLRLRLLMTRTLYKSGVLVSVGILTKIVYFMKILKDRNGVERS